MTTIELSAKDRWNTVSYICSEVYEALFKLEMARLALTALEECPPELHEAYHAAKRAYEILEKRDEELHDAAW